MRLQNSNLIVAGSSSISSSSSGQSGTNIIPQKRLFSPGNSACTGVTHRLSVDLSACGSEFARSPDDAIRHGNFLSEVVSRITIMKVLEISRTLNISIRSKSLFLFEADITRS